MVSGIFLFILALLLGIASATQLDFDSYGVVVPCDGPNFKCNISAADRIHNIHNVTLTGDFKANSTMTFSFDAQLNPDFLITDGTTHYKIWEGRVPTFRQNGAQDYFVCDNFGCDRTKPISLFIDDPSNSSSTCHIVLHFKLPGALATGIYTTDIYGADQGHEPYDFTVNLAFHLNSSKTALRGSA